MTELPAFLDSSRPDVPDLAVPRGITPFYLPNQPVRGRLIRLGPLANTLLTRHDHAVPVRTLLGQALALAAALASALKFSGSFSVQAKGDGPVSMLLADCTDIGALRGYARVLPEAELPVNASARDLLGSGYLAFTVDQGPDREPQQGIVALEGETLAEMAEHYFATSEQLACKVYLAAGATAEGWRASALIIERIAGAGGISPEITAAAQEEAWRTATVLANTITEAELLDDALAPERLLYRLFHAEGDGVAVDRPRVLAYGCRCSRARLGSILEGFSEDDLDHMAIDGDIVMTCEFCNFDFRFPRAGVAGKPGVSP
jgi:molecular chaperone Hsp33